MWQTIVAILLLCFLASYFVSVNLNFGGDTTSFKADDVESAQEYIEELPPSSSDARFKEMRYEFLRFADFFLLVKRPYGIKGDVSGIGPLGAKGKIRKSHVTRSEGLVSGVSSAQQCHDLCFTDMHCNSWELKDSECEKFKLDNIKGIKLDEDEDGTVGYIFRSDDSWAVDDLSALPQKNSVFKGVAEMVVELDCKVPALRSRAESIIASSQAKYCYETEPVSNTNQQYEDVKADAIRSLERAAFFFLFPGDTVDYENKGLYAMCISRLLKRMTIGEDIFYDDIYSKKDKRAINDAVNEVFKVNKDYEKLEKWLTTHDSDYSGYITESELRELIYKQKEEGHGLDVSPLELDDNWGEFDDDDKCLTRNEVDELVATFFAKYDLNNDGKVSLEELADSILPALDDLERPTKCSF